MPVSTGVNRVFLVGNVGRKPKWHVTGNSRMLCLSLSTSEIIKRAGDGYDHVEWHTVKVPSYLADELQIEPGDLLYVQGKIQTKKIIENNVKLYKTEILALTVEHLDNQKSARAFMMQVF